MKTKKMFTYGILLVAASLLSFMGCQKEKTEDVNNDSSSLQQLSIDENTVQVVSDEALADANMVLAGNPLKSTEMWPCNATIDSAYIHNDSITYHITYNGLNCPGTRYRTGVIEITRKIGQHWSQPGASVVIEMINFQVTKVSSGKSVTLNGTKIYTNVTGGIIWQLGNGVSAVVHRLTGTIQATFNNQTSRTWQIARQITYTGSPGQFVMTINGFGVANGWSDLLVWGINRNNEYFYTRITEAVVHRQVCDWDPVSGVKVFSIPSAQKKATITFGFNNQNQPIAPGECPTRYRVDWEKGNHSGTIYLPLP